MVIPFLHLYISFLFAIVFTPVFSVVFVIGGTRLPRPSSLRLPRP
jgi:hypothetical protein